MTTWSQFKQWLWLFLPDNCEGKNCCRKGARGNENVHPGGVLLCDYCSSRLSTHCKFCEVALVKGQALGTRWVGSPDFPGQDGSERGCTVHHDPSKPFLQEVWKCPMCGHSINFRDTILGDENDS